MEAWHNYTQMQQLLQPLAWIDKTLQFFTICVFRYRQVAVQINMFLAFVLDAPSNFNIQFISPLNSTQRNGKRMLRQLSQQNWGLKITRSALRWIGGVLGWLNVVRLISLICYLVTHLVGPFFVWVTGATHTVTT